MNMNHYDIEDASDFWTPGRTKYPVTYRASQILLALMRWTNSNSDGWHSWPKPSRAARRLEDLLTQQFQDFRDDGCRTHVVDGRHVVVKFEDLTEAQLNKALTPIKAFLTRHVGILDETRTAILEAGIPKTTEEDRAEALDEIVHDTASTIASNVVNSGEHIDWLLSQGWSKEQIEEAVLQRVNA